MHICHCAYSSLNIFPLFHFFFKVFYPPTFSSPSKVVLNLIAHPLSSFSSLLVSYWLHVLLRHYGSPDRSGQWAPTRISTAAFPLTFLLNHFTLSNMESIHSHIYFTFLLGSQYLRESHISMLHRLILNLKFSTSGGISKLLSNSFYEH